MLCFPFVQFVFVEFKIYCKTISETKLTINQVAMSLPLETKLHTGLDDIIAAEAPVRPFDIVVPSLYAIYITYVSIYS